MKYVMLAVGIVFSAAAQAGTLQGRFSLSGVT